MQLPPHVRRAIEERADAVGFRALLRAAEALSAAYREGRAAHLPDAERTAAYLVTRMPATYAAACGVLREMWQAGRGAGREPGGPPHISSVLDVGAGAGAASLAARERFPDAALTLIERDAALADAARQFLPAAALLRQDVTRLDPLPPHDLVIAAYSLGEIGAHLASRLWRAARTAMVVIEPGTPKGFALVRAVRDELLAAGARMLAPCPAEMPCPMSGPDWCHFAARVERSSLHRRIKGGELGYEDEKFSYMALARDAVELPAARIIRHPQHQPGLIVLETCTPGGLQTARVVKRDRDAFRAARRAAWGGAWRQTAIP